jgi:uncharacterized SAM-binding protein YcdF (DUF218 family)
MAIVKALFAPGTVPFAILLAGFGVLLLMRPGWSRRSGAAVLVLLPASYVALSLPYVASRLSAPLIHYGQASADDRTGDISAIVVLSGDSQHARVLETLRLAKLFPTRPIVVSGPTVMLEEILAGGVPAGRIVLESASETTRQQALNVGELARSHGFRRVLLIASAIHMPRALAACRAAGIDAVAAPSETRRIAGLPQFWPAANALRLSRDSIYEYVALIYYRWRGWR